MANNEGDDGDEQEGAEQAAAKENVNDDKFGGLLWV
jgi:hypothetical protein